MKDKKKIENELNKTEESKEFWCWVQEFSKKIIFVTFIIFIISCLVIMFILIFQAFTGEIDLTTFITETNTTFREVIGAYIIKACIENVGKIYISKISDLLIIRDKLLKHKLEIETGVEFDNNNNEDKEENIIEVEECDING